jgi:hypothetical protein
MRAADYIVDVGPGAGVHGGNIVCCGTVDDIINCKDSITGQYLSGKRKIELPQERRKGNGNKLVVYSSNDNAGEYQYKSVENGVCYAYYPTRDGGGSFSGHRREVFDSTAEAYTAGWADTLFADAFLYDLFTYNSETKHYEAASLAEGMMTDIWLSFENGKLVAWGYTVHMDMGTGPISITGEFSITYNNVGEITLPTNYFDAE